jgi:3-deoxy-D-manno-octulosonic-acid transferase
MFTFLYTLGMHTMNLALHVLAPFHPKAKLWVNGRKNWKRKLSKEAKRLNQNLPTFWFHVSSLGEFEQGRPLMEEIKRTQKCNLILTFYSPSGFEQMKQWPLPEIIAYLPLDTPANARAFLQRLKPDLFILIKYDYWYHFIAQCYKEKIPIVVASARFLPDQLAFKPWGGWYRKMLRRITHFYAQNTESQTLLKHIGIDQVSLSGDSRFDRVDELSKNSDSFPIVREFVSDKPALIVGSCWPSDEKYLIRFINAHPNSYRYILAPHDVDKKHIADIESALLVHSSRYSEGKNPSKTQVLIIDTIGQLSRIYKYATVAYIGGGFKEGLHNILEPAAYALPVITGPNLEGFPEAFEMKKAGGLLTISDDRTLEKTLMKLQEDNAFRIQVGTFARRYIDQNKGITKVLAGDLLKRQ